jgi:UDP-glucose 4-epimerase
MRLKFQSNKLYNICMDEPVDYGAAAAYLKEPRVWITWTFPATTTRTGWTNSRAKFDLNWRPRNDLACD